MSTVCYGVELLGFVGGIYWLLVDTRTKLIKNVTIVQLWLNINSDVDELNLKLMDTYFLDSLSRAVTQCCKLRRQNLIKV